MSLDRQESRCLPWRARESLFQAGLRPGDPTEVQARKRLAVDLTLAYLIMMALYIPFFSFFEMTLPSNSSGLPLILYFVATLPCSGLALWGYTRVKTVTPLTLSLAGYALAWPWVAWAVDCRLFSANLSTLSWAFTGAVVL
eukprot:RCo030771